MDITGFTSLITAIAGTAGITALLALLSRLSDLRRARSLVESLEGTLKLVVEDQVATSALHLSLRVAVLQLTATSLIRVPLHRLLTQLGKLTGIALVLVVVGMMIMAGLHQILGVNAPASSLSAWALACSVVIGFFLAYRGALSEQRSAFVAEVLYGENIDLEVLRKYNKSFNHPSGATSQSRERATSVKRLDPVRSKR